MNETIAALIKQMKIDAKKIAEATCEADGQMTLGNKNGAIGALLAAEREIEEIESLLKTVRSLARRPA